MEQMQSRNYGGEPADSSDTSTLDTFKYVSHEDLAVNNVSSDQKNDSNLPLGSQTGGEQEDIICGKQKDMGYGWSWDWTWILQGKDLIFKKESTFAMKLISAFMGLVHAPVMFTLGLSGFLKPDTWSGPIIPLFILIFSILEFCAFLGVFNVKTFTINKDVLSIKNKPFPNPFDRNKTFKSDEIIQLYCAKSKRRNKQRGTDSYDITFIFKSGQRLKLLETSDYKLAKKIEKLIEDFLGLENVAVADEHSLDKVLNSLPPKSQKGSHKEPAFDRTWELQGKDLILKEKPPVLQKVFSVFMLAAAGNVPLTILFELLAELSKPGGSIIGPAIGLALGSALFTAMLSVIAVSLSTKTFTINEDVLNIQTKPFPNPFDKNKKFKSNEIIKFYCIEEIPIGLSAMKFHKVMFLLNSGEKIELLKTSSYEQAIYMIKLLEDFLGLKNVETTGEYSE